MSGGVPVSVLERPTVLRRGIGNSHERVTTPSSEAQAFYDQGLDYLESYVWVEAARSFHQALRIDPDLAMAWVGLSRAYSGLDDAASAQRSIEAAKALRSHASAAERARIEIRAKQLEAMAAPKSERRFRAYKKALDEALSKNPDDIGLLLLRGNAEEPSPSGRGQLGTESSIVYYRHVLRLSPDHASAHHFLAHTYEGLGNADSALAHGERFARLVPAIPHAAHMWGHALRKAGRVAEAIAQFQRADALERAYYRSESMEPRYDWHHAHNLNLMAAVYQNDGRRLVPARAAAPFHPGGVPVSLARERNLLPGDAIRAGRPEEALRDAMLMTNDADMAIRAVGRVRAAQSLRTLRRSEAARRELDWARAEVRALPAATGAIVARQAALERAIRQVRGGDTLNGDAARAIVLFELSWMGKRAREIGDWSRASQIADQMLLVDAAYEGSHRAAAWAFDREGYPSAAARERDLASRLGRRAEPDPPLFGAVASR